MKKIVVYASGEGTNFSAIVDSGILVEKVITNNPTAGVIKRAENYGIPVVVLNKNVLDEKPGFGAYNRILDEETPDDTDLIVLAGYMLILPPIFCRKWNKKIINIHPSLLPAFKGSTNAIEEAYDYGCKVFGATVHWVTEKVDDGKIIDQRAMTLPASSLEEVKKMVHSHIEHMMYPQVIKKLLHVKEKWEKTGTKNHDDGSTSVYYEQK